MLIQADGNGYVNDTHKDYYIVHSLSNPNNNYEYWTNCDAEIKLAVKRDPVKRFVSAYKNRIVYHDDLSKDEYFDKDLYLHDHICERYQEHKRNSECWQPQSEIEIAMGKCRYKFHKDRTGQTTYKM